MKRVLFLFLAASSLVAVALITGCENGWSTNDAGFNSSEGAGAQINFSGYYQGVNGGQAVANTSAGNIATLTIQQAGDTVEVTDNHGSTYRGKIGSPGAVSSSSSGSYLPGAELVQAQINFSGHDNVSAKDISFAGVIHAVAIIDIKGNTSSDSKSDSSSYTITTNITISTVGTNKQSTVTISVYDPITGKLVYQEVTTVIQNPSGEEISRKYTQSGNANYATTKTTTYSLTEANTQYRLQGTWVEEGGVTSGVDAISPASSGLITTTTQ